MPPVHGSADIRRGHKLSGINESNLISIDSGGMRSNRQSKVTIKQQAGDLSTKYYTGAKHSVEMGLATGSAASLVSFENTQSKEKLFTRDFYNLERSNKKRDIESVSLHKHPKSHLHGIFDKWRVQEAGHKALHPTTLSPRELFA